MFSTGKTRRGLFTAALAGGVFAAGGMAGASTEAGDLGHLAHLVRAISRASRELDYDDAGAVAAHYAEADPVVAAVIAARATSVAGLRVKAEAFAWCYGGQLPAPAEPTPADRLMASLLADLLGPAANENKNGTKA